MRKIIFPALLSLFFSISFIAGEEWAVLGARALGMGGANVAAARGASAYYWNPALYATEHHYDMDMPIGMGIGIEGDMLEKADFIADRLDTIDLDYLQNTLNDEIALGADSSLVDDSTFQEVFEVFLIDVPQLSDHGTGVSIYAGTGIEVRLGDYGFSAIGLAYAGAHPTINLDISGGLALSDDAIDTILQISDVSYADYYAGFDAYHQGLTDQIIADSGGTATQAAASTFVWLAVNTPPNPNGDTVDLTNPITRDIFLQMAEATFGNDIGETNEVMADNISGIDIGLITMKEAAFTVAKTISESRLALGANIKAIIADTFITSIIISEFDDGEDIVAQVSDIYGTSERAMRLSLDLGCVYALTETAWAGLTVRNINQPVFPYLGDDNGFTLYSQTRAGIAWQATQTLLFAADFDLFPNLSEVIFGYKTQYIAAGLEWQPVQWWALRTGLNKNIATGDSPTYSLGMGFRIAKFYLDFAGSMGFSDIQIESDTTGVKVYLPERFNFMFTMGFSFDF